MRGMQAASSKVLLPRLSNQKLQLGVQQTAQGLFRWGLCRPALHSSSSCKLSWTIACAFAHCCVLSGLGAHCRGSKRSVLYCFVRLQRKAKSSRVLHARSLHRQSASVGLLSIGGSAARQAARHEAGQQGWSASARHLQPWHASSAAGPGLSAAGGHLCCSSVCWESQPGASMELHAMSVTLHGWAGIPCLAGCSESGKLCLSPSLLAAYG